MVDLLSPLGGAYRPGSHGNFAKGFGIRLEEVALGSIVQVAAWPGRSQVMLDALRSVTDLSLGDRPGCGVVTDEGRAFWIAPGRLLVAGEAQGWSARLAESVAADVGTVTDLTHGRVVIGIEGDRAEWVLSKFFAIDFSEPAFPVGDGIATVHHDIFAQIQRTGSHRFELYLFRSYARAFWTSLCHASEEVGYEVR